MGPTSTLLVTDISFLHTMDSDKRELRGAAIYIAGPSIVWVGLSAEIPDQYETADMTLRLMDHVVMPGLTNTHHHTFQNLTRCVAQDVTLVDWLCTMYPAWEKIEGSDLYIAALISFAELILSGCTTTSDHVYLFPNGSRLDDTIQAARDIGVRFHPTRGGSSIGPSKGGYGPESLCEEEGDMLADMERLIGTYHDNSKYSMLRMGLAPTAMLKCSPEFFRSTAALARRHPGVRLHSHLAEVEKEGHDIWEKHGCSHSEFLKKIHWDRDDCWFAHCIQLSDDDMNVFSKQGIGACHCPSSNMRLASGIARVKEMVDAGVSVSLGVDGSASNDTGHMLHEVRLAMLLQRASRDPRAMSCRDALRIGVQGGARNLGRDDIGQIAPGFAADFIAYDTLAHTGFSGAMMDPVAALVLCTPGIGNVDISVINGKIVVKDGKLTTIDLKEAARKHRLASARLCRYLPSNWQTGIKDSRV